MLLHPLHIFSIFVLLSFPQLQQASSELQQSPNPVAAASSPSTPSAYSGAAFAVVSREKQLLLRIAAGKNIKRPFDPDNFRQ
jgi:hypothetical protein